MDNYNYPPGSDVSWAPWNQKDPDLEECPDCDGIGKIFYPDEEEQGRFYTDVCTRCDGTGWVEVDPD